MATSNSTLDNVVCFQLDVSIWCGRRKLTEVDLSAYRGDLPPEKLASLGSKKVFNPERLNVFKKLRKRMERVLSETGARFLKGWAIPVDRVAEVVPRLDAVCRDFDSEVGKLKETYDKDLRDWIASAPAEWRGIIQAGAYTRKEVLTRFGCRYYPFFVNGVESTALRGFLQAAVNDLGETLFEEIATEAQALQEKSIVGKVSVSRATVRSIRQLINKLDGLAFLDARIPLIVEKSNMALDSLPATGKLEGRDYHTIYGVVDMLSKLDTDPDGSVTTFVSAGQPAVVQPVASAPASDPTVTPLVLAPSAPPVSGPTAVLDDNEEDEDALEQSFVL